MARRLAATSRSVPGSGRGGRWADAAGRGVHLAIATIAAVAIAAANAGGRLVALVRLRLSTSATTTTTTTTTTTFHASGAGRASGAVVDVHLRRRQQRVNGLKFEQLTVQQNEVLVDVHQAEGVQGGVDVLLAAQRPAVPVAHLLRLVELLSKEDVREEGEALLAVLLLSTARHNVRQHAPDVDVCKGRRRR